MWFAAHIITVFRYRKRRQRKFRVWENIVLVQAATPEEGWKKARELGEESVRDGSDWTVNGLPATLDYVGVRKLINVDDPEKRPKHGTEITYNKFDLSSRADLEKLVAGDPVSIEYEE